MRLHGGVGDVKNPDTFASASRARVVADSLLVRLAERLIVSRFEIRKADLVVGLFVPRVSDCRRRYAGRSQPENVNGDMMLRAWSVPVCDLSQSTPSGPTRLPT